MKTPPMPARLDHMIWKDLGDMAEIQFFDIKWNQMRYRWDALVGETLLTSPDDHVRDDLYMRGIDYVRGLIRSDFLRIERQLQGKSNDNTAAEAALHEGG